VIGQKELRLGGGEATTFQNGAHFFGAAAEAMRRILIEHARRRLAAKRGWTWVKPVPAGGLGMRMSMLQAGH
jgi:ECF sigma factor